MTLLTRQDCPALAHFEKSIDQNVALCRVLCSYEMRWALRNYRDTGLLSEELCLWLEKAEQLTLDDYRKALHRREQIRSDFAALQPLADAIITLASPGPAPPLGYLAESGEPDYAFKTGSPAFNAATSVLGTPAVTVPLMAVRGLPVGVQLIGHPHTDWELTGHANWLMDTIDPVSI